MNFSTEETGFWIWHPEFWKLLTREGLALRMVGWVRSLSLKVKHSISKSNLRAQTVHLVLSKSEILPTSLSSLSAVCRECALE